MKDLKYSKTFLKIFEIILIYIESFDLGIPDLPKMEKKAPFKPALLVPNCESDYQIQDLGLKVVLDKNLRKMGIWIPETILDENVKVDSAALEVEVYIQLTGPHKSRLINCMATIKKENGKFVLNKQFVHLAPMVHAGTADMTCDIDPSELQTAIK